METSDQEGPGRMVQPLCAPETVEGGGGGYAESACCARDLETLAMPAFAEQDGHARRSPDSSAKTRAN